MADKTPLTERYSAAVIAEAEERRRRAEFPSLRVGRKTGYPRVEFVLSLLYQAHQAHYFGHFAAAATTCGVLLEQCVYTLLCEEIERKGGVTVRDHDEVKKVRSADDLRGYSFYQMTGAAVRAGLVRPEWKSLAHEMRLLRNQMVHLGFPPLRLNGRYWEGEVENNTKDAQKGRCIIQIPVADVKRHCLTETPEEIWSWYILSGTRRLMDELFRKRVERLPSLAPPTPKEGGTAARGGMAEGGHRVEGGA